MATPSSRSSWLQGMACCVKREDDELQKVELPAKPRRRQPVSGAPAKAAEQDWYPFLLHQLKALQADPSALLEKMKMIRPLDVCTPPQQSSLKAETWQPESEPSLSRSSSSNFAIVGTVSQGLGQDLHQTNLKDALSTFRMVEAFNKLELLQATEATDTAARTLDEFSSADFECIRRVGGRSKRHLEWWATAGGAAGGIGDSWPISGSSQDLQLEWGFKVENGLVHAAFSTLVQGDLARAVAALCELGLYSAFNDDFVEASCLEGDKSVHDSIWQLVTHNKVLDVRADNIWQVSVTDALAQSAGVVIVDLTVPELGEKTELRGTPLPTTRQGFSRITFGHSTYFLLPVASQDQEAAFRLVNYSVTRPAAKLTRILDALPTFAQTRILRAGAERTVKRLKQHIMAPMNEALDSAMQTSPRAAVYGVICAHLRDEKTASSNIANEDEDDLESWYSFDDDY